eukprot:776308_1
MMTPMIHHQALTVRNVVNSIHYRKVHLRGDAENVDISINVKSLKNPKKKSKKSKRRKKDPDSNGENGVYHGADLIIDSGVLELALQYMRDRPRANYCCVYAAKIIGCVAKECPSKTTKMLLSKGKGFYYYVS